MENSRHEDASQIAAFFIREIDRLVKKPVRLMEVCGTHTVSIFKAGIRQLLPEQVELVSGPGCPVCVTPNDYLDLAVAYSRQENVLLATFGDMLKVPGSSISLNERRGEGADIRIVYSPLEAVELAAVNPAKKVIFLAVGFETTSPTAAAAILAAKEVRLVNFYVLSSHKLVPPVLRALLNDSTVRVDGFLLPGHVSAVIGEAPYDFLARDYHISGVIAGFKPLDILGAIYRLIKQIHDGRPCIENQYGRVVKPQGNPKALEVLNEVYQKADTAWRGMGVIPGSGLKIRDKYRQYDALLNLPVAPEPTVEPKQCRCGEVLRGLVKPPECKLFGTVCTPEQPVGSCMVSVEGTCAAWYKYKAGRWQV